MYINCFLIENADPRRRRFRGEGLRYNIFNVLLFLFKTKRDRRRIQVVGGTRIYIYNI